MQTGTRGKFTLVLLFSLLIGLSFGGNVRRNGIGAAIAGGIVNTNKAIIGGITGTIGAVVDTAKESNNATETENKRSSRSSYGWDDSSYTANEVDDNLLPQNSPSDDDSGMISEMSEDDYSGAEMSQGYEQFFDLNVPSSTAEPDVDVEGSGNLDEPVVVINEEKSTFGEESSSSSAYGQGAEHLPSSNTNELTYGSKTEEETVEEKKLPASGNKAVKIIAIYKVSRRPQGVSQSVSEGRLGDSGRTKKVARNKRNRKSGSLNANAPVENQRRRRGDDWDDWSDEWDDSRDDSWDDRDDWRDDMDDTWDDLDDDLDDRRRRPILNEIMERRRSRRDDDKKERRVRPNQLTSAGRPRLDDDDDDWDDFNDDDSRERQRQRVLTNRLSPKQRPRRYDDWDDLDDDNSSEEQRNRVSINRLNQKERSRRDDDWDDWFDDDDDCDDADDMFDPECRARLNRRVQSQGNPIPVSSRENTAPTNRLSQRDHPKRDDDWMDDDCDDLDDPECRRRLNPRHVQQQPPVGNPRPNPQQPPMAKPHPVPSQPPMVRPRPVPSQPPIVRPRPVPSQPPIVRPRPVPSQPPIVRPRPVPSHPSMVNPHFVPPHPPMVNPHFVPPHPPMVNPRPVPPRVGQVPAITIREESRPVSPKEGNVSAKPMKDQRPDSPKREQVPDAPVGNPQPIQPNNDQGHPRRFRRSVGSAVVGGVTETSKAVANGTENVVDVATGNKKDNAKSKKTKGTNKASKIGGAVVDGIAGTANSIATGVEGTVDEAKKGAKTTTTTTSKPKETSSSSNATCKSHNVCYGDSDCNGGKCIGAFVGTCNCNACFNFVTCTSDEGCGGLKGACDMNTKRCNCQEAHRKLGYPNYFDALTKFCNHQTCDGSSNSCNGLPCTSGRCFC